MTAAFLSVVSVLGAQVPDASSPFQIRNVHTRDHAMGTELAFQIVNQSTRDIAAYDIAVVIRREGKTGMVFHKTGVMTDRRKPIRPGQILEMKGSGVQAGEAFPEHEIVVDYVLFADGTSWGENKYGGSEKVARLQLHSQKQRM
jgi:hypothetical protein